MLINPAAFDEPLRAPGNAPSAKAIRVLLVEDNEGDFVLLRTMLSRIDHATYEVEWVRDLEAALVALDRRAHDVALVDFYLASDSAIDFLREANLRDWPAPVIVLTGLEDSTNDMMAMKIGAYDFMCKAQLRPNMIERSIRYAISQKSAELIAAQTNQELLKHIRDLRVAQKEIEAQRQRIVSLAYHLASAGHGAEQAPPHTSHALGVHGGTTSPVGVWRFGADGGIIAADAVVWRLLEVEGEEELRNKRLPDVLSEEDLLKLERAQEMLRTHTECTLEMRLVGLRTGRRTWVVASLVAGEPSEEGATYQATVVDITDRRNEEETLQFLAFHDGLTGLKNRTTLERDLAAALASARRTNSMVAILCIDLDGFKGINDHNGHAAGDHVLKAVAERLKRRLRETDVAARLGGDEFVVIGNNITSRTDAEFFVGQISNVINAPVDYRETQIQVRGSIGVALFPGSGTDAEKLLEAADLALYEAKANPQRTYVLYDSARLADGSGGAPTRNGG